MPFDVLLVDDHKIVLDGIKAILKQHAEFRVLGEASSGQEAMQFLKRTPVDLIVMDLKLQGLTGVEVTSEILRYFPDARIIMLSGYPDEDSVVGSLKAGARAFVLKDAGEADLIDALRTVARGGTYLSAQVPDGLLRRLQNGTLSSKTQVPLIKGLSPRELQVMKMVAEGKSSKEIGMLLDLGLQTVRSHRKTLMKKLGLDNVAGLTQAALAAGITHPSMVSHKPSVYSSAERDAKILVESIRAMCGDPSLLDDGEDPPAKSVMHRASKFIAETYLLLSEPPPANTVGMYFGEINVSWRTCGHMVRLAFFDHRPTLLTIGSLSEPVGSYQSTSNPTPNQVAIRLNALEPYGGVSLSPTSSVDSLAS